MIGAFKLNSIAKAAAVASGGVPNTWDTTAHTSALTGLTRYTGMNNRGIAIHGVQNTNKLVLIFGTQNSARTAHTLYPACYDLSTGTLAVGSGVSVGNTHPTGTPYIDCSVAGEGNIGMLSVTTLVSTSWRNYVRGYTISNWGSISTTNLPTLTLSTAYTKGTGGSVPFVGYVGNNRFAVSSRDDAVGDTNCMDVFNHNGSSAPTLYRAGIAGGARNSEQPIGIRAGISSTNYAAYYAMVGNNNNFLVPEYVQGNGSGMYQYSNDGGLSSAGGNSFVGKIINDISGSVVAVNQMKNGSAENRITVSKWTNANTPTTAPTVTTSSTYQTTYGAFANILPVGDKTSSTAYVPIYVSSSSTRFDKLNINTTALNISSQTTGVATTSPWTGDMYFQEWYHSTYGQYIIAWSYNTGTGAISFYFNKWNP